jgi:hypothetical protein
MATVTKKSMISGVVRTMEIPQYTQEEFDNRYILWREGKILLQDAFEDTSANAREFIKTGMTVEEWDQYITTGA